MPSSPLPPVSRYLWAQGAMAAPLAAGTVLAGRYQVVEFPLVQDLAPEEPPTALTAVPPLAEPYLALSSFSVVVPRPFTQVMLPDGHTPLLLLEEAPLAYPPGTSQPRLLPALADVWEKATPLYQLTWLWRLAKLWQPCVEANVAHTLLDWQNIRVDGEDVRLLTLTAQAESLTLVNLGQRWRSLIATADPAIQGYLTHLTDLLCGGQGQPKALVYSLVQAIQHWSTPQPLTVAWATASDQGPTRQRNEDACHPPSGFVGHTTVQVATATAVPLVVVCDGVGGHQGGDVAAQTAIAEVTQHLTPLLSAPNLPHGEVVIALKRAILTANQAITAQNDAAQRQERDRMGTTLVLALVYGARLYLAHVGDSRAYRVRSHNCRQLTLDDDVAAREMRLGLGLYQDALQNPGAGALVQALGMADSSHLRPTVKLYPIASESLLVLCSDGLSDNGLLDRLWQTELKPILSGDRDVATGSQRLITLANTHNGHDNVTVGLLRLTPAPAPAMTLPAELAELLLTTPPTTRLQPAPSSPPPPATTPPPTVAVPPPRPWRPLPLVFSGVLVAGLVGIAGALGWQWWSQRAAPIGPAPGGDRNGETLAPAATPPSTTATPALDLSVGDYRQIKQLPDPSAAVTLRVSDGPPVPAPPTAVAIPERILTIGSIVQVQARQKTADNQVWVRLQVCALAATETADGVAVPPATTGDRPLPLAQPGDQGWLLEAEVPTFATPLLDTSPAQQGLCID
ncbi:MAG TPA: protein phosphatase 2C domain-containing protein [Candidatus Obscuribacterales bacterium]